MTRRWIGPFACFAAVFALTIALGFCEMLVHPMTAHGYPAKVTRWTPTIRAACAHEHLSRSDTAWLLAKVPGIIYRESRGNTRTGHRAGSYGLLQFSSSFHFHNRSWAPGHPRHADWRGCGTCSIYRLVWGFHHSSGRAWVTSTWRATIR